ncbi:LysR substrate-binding domain-containing protein [Asanoa sp. NPDC050611]|uniref:LysR substrate-binding domain-containing protein n=1 Tax=Asanoa sp. NPDC050611 TaxID=3157098 RepID=UPI00340F2DA6
MRHRHTDADLSVVDITSDQGMPAVAAGDLDLAVIAAWDQPPAPPEHVRLHPLLTDPMVVVLPDDHPLAAGTGPLRLGCCTTWPATCPLPDIRRIDR